VLGFSSMLETAVESREAEAFAAEAARHRNAFVKDVDRALGALGAPAGAGRRQPMVKTLESIRLALPTQVDEMTRMARAGEWAAVARRLENQVKPHSLVTGTLVEEIDAAVGHEQAHSLENIQRVQRQAAWTLTATGVLTLLLAAVLGTGVTRSITRPLVRLDRAAQALAKGDFQHEVTVSGGDELASLGRVFNETASRLRTLYGTLRSSEEHFHTLARVSPVGIFRVDAEGRSVYVNERWSEITGVDAEAARAGGWLVGVHPDDEERVVAERARSERERLPFRSEYRCQRPDGIVTWVLGEAVGLLALDGTVLGHVGTLTDITAGKRAEAQIRASLREKEVLLKELHHRVKNNLQVVISLLNLQSGQLRDPHDLELFRESQDRVRSMALVHEKLYGARDLAQVDFAEYVTSLASQLLRSHGVGDGSVDLRLEVESAFFGVDTAIPCGLIINELVSNALKHGFPGGRSGQIRVELRPRDGGQWVLRVSDDGVGLPGDFELGSTSSLGLQLVSTLAAQIEGAVRIDRAAGTSFEVVFSSDDAGRA